jgi:hypothetical protein
MKKLTLILSAAGVLAFAFAVWAGPEQYSSGKEMKQAVVPSP